MLKQVGVLPGSAPRGKVCDLDAVLRHIDRHLDEPLRLEDLAVMTGLSVWRFATVFRQQMGIPPHRHVCHRRVQYAQHLLGQGVPVACVATLAGFYDQSHLSRHFKQACGMTPGQFRNQRRSTIALSA